MQLRHSESTHCSQVTHSNAILAAAECVDWLPSLLTSSRQHSRGHHSDWCRPAEALPERKPMQPYRTMRHIDIRPPTADSRTREVSIFRLRLLYLSFPAINRNKTIKIAQNFRCWISTYIFAQINEIVDVIVIADVIGGGARCELWSKSPFQSIGRQIQSALEQHFIVQRCYRRFGLPLHIRTQFIGRCRCGVCRLRRCQTQIVLEK